MSTLAKEVPESPRLQRLSENLVCSRVGRDLTWEAQHHAPLPLVGLEKEKHRIYRRLLSSHARNLLIVGVSGVGKTALVESIADDLAGENCPQALRGKRIIRTSFADIWSEVDRSDNWAAYVKTLKQLIRETSELGLILNMEEFHLTAQYPCSMAYLRSVLGTPDFCMVGTATEREFYNFLEFDRATLRHFDIVRLREPRRDSTLEILKRRLPPFREETGCDVQGDRAIEAVVDLTDAYVVHEAQPGKSIRILEQVAVDKSIENDPSPIVEEDVRRGVCREVGLDYELMTAPADRLNAMEALLKSRILGQDEAIEAVCRRLLISRSELSVSPNRPDGVFLAAGPTGVGKSMLAEQIAKILTGNERNLVRIDMNAFVTADSVFAITGVPGEESTERRQMMPVLTRRLRSSAGTVICLDEIEKAHPRVLQVFLQAIDTGVFRDHLGNEASLRNSVVVMTSNVGHSEPRKRVGLIREEANLRADTLRAVRASFPREFMGRVDEVLIFEPLTPDIMRRFVEVRLRVLERRSGKRIELTAAAVDLLCERGFHADYGAREINRALDGLLGAPLARLKATEVWDRANAIVVDRRPGSEELVPALGDGR